MSNRDDGDPDDRDRDGDGDGDADGHSDASDVTDANGHSHSHAGGEASDATDANGHSHSHAGGEASDATDANGHGHAGGEASDATDANGHSHAGGEASAATDANGHSHAGGEASAATDHSAATGPSGGSAASEATDHSAATDRGDPSGRGASNGHSDASGKRAASGRGATGDIILECRDLSVGYDKPILEHVDLVIRRGEIVALLGGSGCGKSTLLRTIIGLLPPLAGEVVVFGQSMYQLPADERSRLLRRTGTAFQQDALFGSMTIEDNVALPLRELTRLPAAVIYEMVRMRLALVGLVGLEHRMPMAISGGQRKRAALARASILDPELVFCDEPSAGLDPVVAAGIDETLLKFRAALGVTLAVVTHELESIRTIADRAVLFAHGGIRAAGTIDELSQSTDPEVFGFFHRVAELPATTTGPAGSITT